MWLELLGVISHHSTTANWICSKDERHSAIGIACSSVNLKTLEEDKTACAKSC